MPGLVANWECPPLWEGLPCAIIGGGPSVLDVDLGALSGTRVITVNNSYATYPDAEFHYFHDRRWWVDYGHSKLFWPTARGSLVTCCAGDVPLRPPANRWAYTMTRLRPGPVHNKTTCPDGMTEDRRTLVGLDSGTQALNLAFHLGADPTLLVGFDMTSHNGLLHHHKEHPKQSHETNYQKRFLPQYDLVAKFLTARKRTVLNCSAFSAITHFPKVTLEEALR